MIDTLNFHNKIDINVNSLIPMPTVQQQRIDFSPKMCGFQKITQREKMELWTQQLGWFQWLESDLPAHKQQTIVNISMVRGPLRWMHLPRTARCFQSQAWPLTIAFDIRDWYGTCYFAVSLCVFRGCSQLCQMFMLDFPASHVTLFPPHNNNKTYQVWLRFQVCADMLSISTIVIYHLENNLQKMWSVFSWDWTTLELVSDNVSIKFDARWESFKLWLL